MNRTVTATITSLDNRPCEGCALTFIPEDLTPSSVNASTDAAGDLRVALEIDVPYAVGVMGGVQVDGQPLAAVAVIRLTVPEGDGPIALLDCATQILSTEWPVLLARLEGVEQWIATHDQEVI